MASCGESPKGVKAFFFFYLYWRWRIQHILKSKMATSVQILLTKFLYQLQIIQAVGQWHGLFQTYIYKTKKISVRHFSYLTNLSFPSTHIYLQATFSSLTKMHKLTLEFTTSKISHLCFYANSFQNIIWLQHKLIFNHLDFIIQMTF